MECTYLNKTRERRWKEYTKDFDAIEKRAEEFLKLKKNNVLSVILVKDKKIQEINRDYRNIDRPTDVISFALQDSTDPFEADFADVELGDIFINVDAAVRQAEEYGHSQRREICFLFTHGLLHLLGYDHQDESQEKEMFDLQDQILEGIVPRYDQ